MAGWVTVRADESRCRGESPPTPNPNPSPNPSPNPHPHPNQADLNRQPVIEFADASFDACLCVVSVDYLTQPREVLGEVHRVLRPGGRAIFSFSNRCFPSKAVKVWLQSDDAARQKIVASYFAFSPTGGWEDIGGERLPEVKVAPPTTMEGFMGKLQAAVGKWAVNGDPMFVVSATKRS